MFGVFVHPKRIGSTRPVAEMSVPGSSRSVFENGHVPIVNAPVQKLRSASGAVHERVEDAPHIGAGRDEPSLKPPRS